ncbi:ferrous iron transport protein B [Succinivibrio dextrinosolvens DSM 3072]|uniref:Ferrous iron transport protein B n=1 Tax=Succinivibrio dextrinosolvens DSM 3072 TaxID=1123324 RepID=A0A1T4VL28_9GAMM|nr:ferrous iron transport protein B [Succinivibrio dextrinosolvens]SKA65617.1 ferrous iron transport protein B [Succinivibrio dextrinosolvens DSM 3072]
MSQKTIALLGNQNCGKTTLFNVLTGSNQYVGNWPGVTVDKVIGKISSKDWDVVDLPGLYSLSPYSPEEIVSRNYLLSDDYDVILNIVDASHLERSLSLTLELAAFGKPMVVALNMIDVMEKTGTKLDVDKLGEKLGVKVVDISASNRIGIDKVLDAVAEAKAPVITNFFDAEISEKIDEVGKTLDDANLSDSARRFIATGIVQNDEIYLEEYKTSEKVMIAAARVRNDIESKFNTDAQSYFPQARYQFIDSVLEDSKITTESKTSVISKAIDKVVLNRFLALPIFFVVVSLVYYGAMYFTSYLELIPFEGEEGTEYATITDWVNDNLFGGYVTDAVASLCESAAAPEWLSSLAVDGVVGGVGAVLGFLPQIAFLFLFLSFLEQSGYMTRVAFVLDRIFRKFGLSGRNFIPMVIATGCGVPALMANKTIDNINERRIGLITTTFIPCSAKLPIITMIFASCFDGAWWFAPMVYALAIFSIVATGVILKKNRAFKEEVSPFVMEIPDYHLPTLNNILKAVYERCRAFVIKAGTIIFAVVVTVWFLASFGFGEEGFGMVENVDASLLAAIGTALCFIFAPLGFGSWQATVAVVNGLLAKENVVGTMAVVLGLDGEFEGGESDLNTALTQYFADMLGVEPTAALVPLLGLSFLAFNMWSVPCCAALGAMKRQLGSTKWWIFAMTYMCVWAYCLALVIFRIGGLIMGVLPFSFYTLVAFIVLAVFAYLLFRKDNSGLTPIRIPSRQV